MKILLVFYPISAAAKFRRNSSGLPPAVVASQKTLKQVCESGIKAERKAFFSIHTPWSWAGTRICRQKPKNMVVCCRKRVSGGYNDRFVAGRQCPFRQQATGIVLSIT
ncbi:MAG: hypothetical protein IIA05_02135 [Proteobacteria bacterium]|nr:hypothetical protein [Pseudomonadota bacterium]